MTFVFQDSTEMPYNKNFIADLNNFLGLIEKTLPIENKIVELKSQIHEEEGKYTTETTMLDDFLSELNSSLDQLSHQYTIESTAKCRDKLKESGAACVEKHKEQLKITLNDINRSSKDDIVLMSNELRKELEPFLWTGVYNVNMIRLITHRADTLTGSITMNLNGLSYTYETTYADFPLQVKKFMDEISIPVWSRGGLIHKEDRIKQLDISDYVIKRIYTGEDFQMDLENKKGTKKVNLVVPEEMSNASLMYVDEEVTDITSNDELAPQVDINKLDELRQKVMEYIGDDANIITRILVNIEIDEKDAIENNELFECTKIIASQYGEIINDIFNHGITKKEIVIKERMEDGSRNEIFVRVEEISNRLSALGGDGLEIKGLLNL
ncbi:MAG: hypothetical protein M8349_06260 [ANME-2 cluster archaeon]|nr:hypothetical protein [ANME-2 cluster archaeon]